MTDPIDRVVEETRALLAERPGPDVTAAVMSQIENLEPAAAPRRAGPFARLAAMLWTPREFAIRPAFALGAAALMVVLLAVPYIENDSTVDTSAASAGA